MKNMKKKSILLLALTVLLLTCVVGSTIAYLATKSAEVSNTFTPTQVATAVVENFSSNKKDNVKIQNTGTTDAFIRATVVVTWQDAKGVVYAQKPVEGEDYEIKWSKTGWTGPKDGFYYYKSEVAPNGVTGVLFTDCKPLTAAPMDGYTLHVEIIGQGIQSKPESTVEAVWGVVPSSMN